jgi:hypothetical protein
MIKPKCFQNKDKVYKEIRGIAYASNGYLLPCCWLDVKHIEDELKEHGFYNDELKLNNVECVEDIITSDVWKEYTRKLINEPEKCISRCKKYCGS